jgi:hypothetical protein
MDNDELLEKKVKDDIQDRKDHRVEDDYDALNPNIASGGQVSGTHDVDINEQTNIELGALANPGGMDPAVDSQQMKEDFTIIRKKHNLSQNNK